MKMSKRAGLPSVSILGDTDREFYTKQAYAQLSNSVDVESLKQKPVRTKSFRKSYDRSQFNRSEIPSKPFI